MGWQFIFDTLDYYRSGMSLARSQNIPCDNTVICAGRREGQSRSRQHSIHVVTFKPGAGADSLEKEKKEGVLLSLTPPFCIVLRTPSALHVVAR
jgi:hypothetical protein